MSKPTLVSSQNMPDIARRSLNEAQDTLDWVGMSHVHQPLLVKDGEISKAVQELYGLVGLVEKFIHLIQRRLHPLH